MRIAVKASEEQRVEFLSKGNYDGIGITWLGQADDIWQIEADAYFILSLNEELALLDELPAKKIVFVNSVCRARKQTAAASCVRINAWPGFLSRSIVEIAGAEGHKKQAEAVLSTLGWRFAWVPDQPGMVAARIISMVINEAYFALGEGISSREEIDTAMKLGTNYPYGPFEWAKKIGCEKIFYLLKKLQQQNAERYRPAPLLEQEVLNHGFIA